MEGGPPIFRQDFTCPALLERLIFYRYGAITHFGCVFQRIPLDSQHGLVRVRSPLLTESLLMSFPPGTEMFQFPGFAFKSLCVQLLNPDFSNQLSVLRRRIEIRRQIPDN